MAGHRGPTIRVIVPLVSVAIIVVILGLLYTCSRKSVKISHRARPSLRLTTRKSTRTLRPRLHLNMQMTEMVVAPPLAENPDSADVETSLESSGNVTPRWRKKVKISHHARPSVRRATRNSTRTLRPRKQLNIQMTEMVVAPPLAENPDSADVEYIARRRHSARLLGRWAVGSPH